MSFDECEWLNSCWLYVPSLEARTKEVMREFSKIYEQQYVVALFNSVRFEIEGGGGPQSQLLHRKAGLILLGLKEKVETGTMLI